MRDDKTIYVCVIFTHQKCGHRRRWLPLQRVGKRLCWQSESIVIRRKTSLVGHWIKVGRKGKPVFVKPKYVIDLIPLDTFTPRYWIDIDLARDEVGISGEVFRNVLGIEV